MEIAKRTYISETLNPMKEKIFARLKAKKSCPRLYCITLPVWESAVLEIYPYNELRSKFYEDKEIVVVGIAVNEADALIILRRLINDIAKAGKLNQVEEYFCGVSRQ